MVKMIRVSEKDFTEHVRRICRSNIRKGIKICIVCPFREHALRIMKDNGWKLPDKNIIQRNYIYLGDKFTDPKLTNKKCRAVLREDGKCIKAGSKMLVEFPRYGKCVVLMRRLRRTNLNLLLYKMPTEQKAAGIFLLAVFCLF